MRIIVLLILLTGCTNHNLELQKENERLKIEVDSLKSEINKCDMMLKAYEGHSLFL